MRYRLTFVAGLALGYVLGTRAGRERYEKLKDSARGLARNPAVRNAAESAAQQSRDFAGKALHTVGEKVGDRMPPAMAGHMKSLKDRVHHNGSTASSSDDWGTSNT